MNGAGSAVLVVSKDKSFVVVTTLCPVCDREVSDFDLRSLETDGRCVLCTIERLGKCEWCGRRFKAAAKGFIGRFCSGRCRVAAHRAKAPSPS